MAEICMLLKFTLVQKNVVLLSTLGIHDFHKLTEICKHFTSPVGTCLQFFYRDFSFTFPVQGRVSTSLS